MKYVPSHCLLLVNQIQIFLTTFLLRAATLSAMAQTTFTVIDVQYIHQRTVTTDRKKHVGCFIGHIYLVAEFKRLTFKLTDQCNIHFAN